jgi:RecA/RadA recombinase
MDPSWTPRGTIVEVVGRISSGRTSVLMQALAATTQAGGAVALLDVDHVFDAARAARAGVDLRRLLWVRCRHARDVALRATHIVARCHGFALVALDMGEVPARLSLPAAFRLKRALRGTDTRLLVVARRRIMGAAADVAVETVQERCEWSGAGSTPRRLAAVRTRFHVMRPHAATHPHGGAWPEDARWTA